MTYDLRQIAQTHWTLALETDWTGRGEHPWKPKGGYSGGGGSHLTEQIRRAHSREDGLLVCYRCAAEDSHIAPDCRSGKVHCTVCNEDSHSTKAHPYQERRKKVAGDAANGKNKRRKKNQAARRAVTGGNGTTPALPVAPTLPSGQQSTPVVPQPAGTTHRTCAVVDNIHPEDYNPIIVESESDSEFVCRIRGGENEIRSCESEKVYSETDDSSDEEGGTHQFVRISPKADRCSLKKNLRSTRKKEKVSQISNQIFEKVNRIGSRDARSPQMIFT